MADLKLNSVLVVGGCGFLGHHIVKQLIENGSQDISVMDLRTTNNRFPDVSYYNADITSSEAVQAVLDQAKPIMIIHTASPVAVDTTPPAVYTKVNVEGTRTLLKCAADTGYVKAFVYTSSASIIHDTIHDLNFADESKPVLVYPAQPDYYSHTKGVAEGLVLDANRTLNKDMLTCSIRPAGLFGEGDSQTIPGAVAVYREGKHNWQIGNNQNLFDFTYVGNAVLAHLLAAHALMQTHALSIEPLDTERIDGEAFIITNDEPTPFWDIMRMIWREAGWQGKPEDARIISRSLGLFLAILVEWIWWIVFFGQKQPALRSKSIRYGCMTRTFSIEKAKRRLGYKPDVSIKDGMKRGVKWYLEKEAETKKAQ